MTELVTVGKVWDLAQPRRRTGGSVFDTVVMDAPATGHALALLRAARTYANVARVGPIARQASLIDGFLRDRSATGVVCVALPEEMPVNETIDLEDRLAADLEMEVERIVVNGVRPDRFSAADADRLRGVGERGSQAARAAIESAVVEHGRVAAQREQLERLRSEARAPVTTLPHLFEAELQRRELELLSDLLEEEL